MKTLAVENLFDSENSDAGVTPPPSNVAIQRTYTYKKHTHDNWTLRLAYIYLIYNNYFLTIHSHYSC